ncbi:hypothetical protein KY289_011653 [Solanum tuberosum]|nr:hypothetical protein KY289_011653 [Solanum tuberosum]
MTLQVTGIGPFVSSFLKFVKSSKLHISYKIECSSFLMMTNLFNSSPFTSSPYRHDHVLFKGASITGEPVVFDSYHRNSNMLDTKSLTIISNGIPHAGSSVLKRKVPNKLSEMEFNKGYQDDQFDPSYSKSGFYEVSGSDI